jgi:diguanylate cyclase (GGDEF)-like protein
MADLDFFKQVNDQYGHQAGDAVLRQVAQIIRRNLRESDLLVRYGGEEFLILLHDPPEGGARYVAEKIRAALEGTLLGLPDGKQLAKTISLGVARFPEHGDTLYKVIKFADVALYAAKDQGRNRVVRFEPAMWQEDAY